eukprot:1970879-Pyramimonas_sp.AAC.1
MGESGSPQQVVRRRGFLLGGGGDKSSTAPGCNLVRLWKIATCSAWSSPDCSPWHPAIGGCSAPEGDGRAARGGKAASSGFPVLPPRPS